MKIEELSIGDFIFFTDGDCVVSVQEIYSDAQLLVSDKDSISEPVHITHLHPIPLTPEILEKNGINNTYESDEYAVYKGKGFNVTYHYTGLWEFSLRRNRVMLKNVHELQHALRLAGIEKEIEV